jgi:hypothetical protein
MGILDRIKKKQNEGFREFVINMESSSGANRAQIFTAGVLEDPVFMSYVMKNLRTFEDFIKLGPDEIELVLKHQDQLIPLFARSIYGSPPEFFKELESVIPRLMARIKEELTYLSEVTQRDKESARSFILKTVRKLQADETIIGFRWTLPPQEVYYPAQIKDGPGILYFENGAIAASGLYLKSKRTGEWRHYYENGKLLALGEYSGGLKTGLWKFYYSDGLVKSEGEYQDDERTGCWKEYDRQGIVTEVQYIDGIKRNL